jgi:hypothetical protein
MNVILLCSRRPIVAEFLLLAETLEENDLQPVLVVPPGLIQSLPALPSSWRIISTDVAVWRKAGLGAFLRYAGLTLLRRLSTISSRARNSLIPDFLSTWEAVMRGKLFAGQVLNLSRTTCAAILTADDRDIRFDQGVIAFGRKNKIPVLTVAFGKSDPDADFFRRNNATHQIDSPPFRSLKNRIAKRYPAGIRTSAQTGPLLFFRPGEYLALSLHGSLFPTPWSYGGGTGDKVAVIDRQAADMLSALGVSEEKISVAGQCSHDVLWAFRAERNAIRENLNARHGFAATDKLMVVALPVFGEHGMSDKSVHVAETEWLLATLASVRNSAVLVSLHPRQKRSDYESLARSLHVSIADEPLRNVLAAADLFVANSSTISWAQLLKIPTIALEYYDLGYELFGNEPGVLTVRSRDDLRATCEAALYDADTMLPLNTALDALGDNVPFDGKARQRIVAEIAQHR